MLALISYLVIWICLSIGFFIYLKKTRDYQKINYYILLALLGLWINVGSFNEISIYYSKYLNSWTSPLVFGLFFMVQSIVRVPLAILSNKIRSRLGIFRIIFSLMFFIFILGILINKDWLIWIYAIILGIIASTYGLQNQYSVENYNFKYIFKTVGIIFVLSLIGQGIGDLIVNLSSVYKLSIRTIWIMTTCLSIPSLIMFWLLKEDKSTIRLDDRLPSVLQYKFQKNEKIFLYSEIFITSFFFNLIFDFGGRNYYQISWEYYWYATIIVIALTLISGLIMTIFALKKIGILNSRALGHWLIIAGIVINLIFSILKIHSYYAFLIGYEIAQTGYTIVFIVLFGTALHANFKNSILVSAVFLSFNSTAIALGVFTNNSIYLNIDARTLESWMTIVLISIGLVAFLLLHIYTHFINRKVRYIFEKTIEYEYLHDH